MTTNFPSYDPYGAGSPYGAYRPAPQPPASNPARRRRLVAAGIASAVVAALVGGFALGTARSTTVSGSGSVAQLLPTIPGDMNRGSSGRSASVALATAEQQKGVVTIVSVLRYQNAESAGTGMILTPDGEILTNNHVVDGATSISVTVPSTGKSYRADVVGTAPSDDVAVLQLRGASGLDTANVGDSSGVRVGDDVVGVGNAGGTGILRAAEGDVTALNRAITATDENGQDSERLTGLIETDAAIVAGDSGGPLYDADSEIIGMDTAASANQAVDSTAYAIPIDTAVKIAGKIESGVETSTIHIGLPAFLGVGVGDSGRRGATVTTLLEGGPAASAGIRPGAVITRVGTNTVTSADSLRAALRDYDPGDKATITWMSPGGTTHHATVTLGTGPAD